MRDNLPKCIIVVALIVAAFVARGHFAPMSQSADISNITMSSPSGTVPLTGADGVGTALADTGAVAGAAPIAQSVDTDAATAPFSDVGGAPAPSLDYHEALIADLTTGDILWGDADASRWPMASLTKLMTATVANDVLTASETVTITPQMFAVDTTESTLKVGDTYTVADMMHIMLLRSSNVAAEALAEFYGRTQFLTLMNQRAASYGMADTYYNDPSGLSSANESSADDLLRLAQNVYTSYPQILAITRKPQAIVTNLATGKKTTIQSINQFAGQPDFLGGKTGYTEVADGNLLSIFRYENRSVLVIIMGTDDASRFTNTTTLFNWFKMNYK